MLDIFLLLFQIIVILAAARIVGLLFRRIHQPQVIGEMVAGILLGPSLLGWAAPDVFNSLFPADSLAYLSALSQVGLIIFMFLVGLELKPGILRGRERMAIMTGSSSILAPFLLGMLLAVYLYPRLSDGSVPVLNFALFIGTAMAITAFPILARILSERKLLNTQLGIVAIACAVLNDIIAWFVLAGVVLLSRTKEAPLPLWAAVGMTIAFTLLMLFALRPLVLQIERRYEKSGVVTNDTLAFILLIAFTSAWITEWLGIHAIFGAFLAGLIMPKKHSFVIALTEKLNDFAVVLLLPLYFALTGLQASIGLVQGMEMWFYCILIVLAAIAGKFAGSIVAARATGMSWHEAGALGALLNTRGLIELILLNIGLEIGVITPVLYTMMVIMAIITTLSTAPLMEIIYFRRLIPGKYLAPSSDPLLAEAEEYLPVE